MKALLPDIKMILMLRNPVDSAYSCWNMRYIEKRLITEGLTLNRQSKVQIKDLSFSSLVDHYLAQREDQMYISRRPLDLIHRGLYIDQIEHLLKYFKREQLLLIISERFQKDQNKGYNEICSFLEIPPFREGPFIHFNKGEYKKSMPAHTKKKLQELYAPFNERLFDLLGFQIKEWN